MLHSAITCAFAYVLIGSTLWVVLDGLGWIETSAEPRFARVRFPAVSLVLATIFAIVAWPLFAFRLLRGVR